METKRRANDAQAFPGMLADHSPRLLLNGLSSVLEDIEKRSRVLLEKGAAARFLDKREDSAEVVRLIERLREAIAHYQVSEDCFVVPSLAYTGVDIATASDLRSCCESYCKDFPVCLCLSC